MGSPDPNWDAMKMLDLYIHDYMKKKGMTETAQIFAEEAGVENTSVAIDPPEGFLTEWFSLFWDVFNSRMQQNPQAQEGTSAQENVYHGVPRPDMNPQMGAQMVPPLSSQLAQQMVPQQGPQMMPQLAPQMIPPLTSHLAQQLAPQLGQQFSHDTNYENSLGPIASLFLAEQQRVPTRDLTANILRLNVDQRARGHASNSSSFSLSQTDVPQQRAHRASRLNSFRRSVASSSTSNGAEQPGNPSAAAFDEGARDKMRTQR